MGIVTVVGQRDIKQLIVGHVLQKLEPQSVVACMAIRPEMFRAFKTNVG
jgi:hypothetical protein